MAEKIFADGIKVFAARQGAPSFVRGSVVIGIDQLLEWANKNPELLSDYKGSRQIRLDLLDGKTGLYLQVNTFKPQGGESHKAVPMANGGDDDGSDLPF